jgi:hypothetical protein
MNFALIFKTNLVDFPLVFFVWPPKLFSLSNYEDVACYRGAND